jgi:hypothetical protein
MQQLLHRGGAVTQHGPDEILDTAWGDLKIASRFRSDIRSGDRRRPGSADRRASQTFDQSSQPLRSHLPKRLRRCATCGHVQHAGPVPIAFGPNDHVGVAVERDGVGTGLEVEDHLGVGEVGKRELAIVA